MFTKLRQPKVVGEIFAGIVLGPALLGRLQLGSYSFPALCKHHAPILEFVYWMGLLLLMFLSGTETKQLFTREERREVGWLTVVGTGIPFLVGLVLGPMLAGPALSGPRGNKASLVIILAVGVAVTSVPVISKIFADLKILHTGFPRLFLGGASLENLVLGVVLVVPTAREEPAALQPRHIAYHLIATIGFFALGLTLLPRAVK